jgi:hypothetical protein
MQEFWNTYGFYLWALTTALVLVALLWLAWNTWGHEPEEAPEHVLEPMDERVADILESVPLMQASLGRTVQFVGLERFADAAGSAGFALALLNARGDGIVLTHKVGLLSATSVKMWTSANGAMLSEEEKLAVTQAHQQLEQTVRMA